MDKICPVTLLGEYVKPCIEEECMLWMKKEKDCAIKMYLTEEERYVPSKQSENKGYL